MSRYDKPHPERLGAPMAFDDAVELAEVEVEFAGDFVELRRRVVAAKADLKAKGAAWEHPLGDLAQDERERLEFRRVFGDGRWVHDLIDRE